MTSKAVLAYANRIDDNLTAVTGTWTARPLANLAIPQLPVPYALATPDDGELAITWTPDTATPIDVLAVLAHTLPAGAVVTWTDEAENVLASVEYQPLANRHRAANVVAVLPQRATVEAITVTITSAGSDPVRIGGLWASRALFFDADRGAEWVPNDFSLAGQVEATRWPNRRTIADSVSCTASRIVDNQAYGNDGSENFKGVFEEVGTSRPVIYLRRATTQADIDRWHVVGYLNRARINHLRGPLNRVQFSVEEMR